MYRIKTTIIESYSTMKILFLFIEPQINDYNIKFIPGIYRVNITWNKVSAIIVKH